MKLVVVLVLLERLSPIWFVGTLSPDSVCVCVCAFSLIVAIIICPLWSLSVVGPNQDVAACASTVFCLFSLLFKVKSIRIGLLLLLSGYMCVCGGHQSIDCFSQRVLYWPTNNPSILHRQNIFITRSSCGVLALCNYYKLIPKVFHFVVGSHC